MKILSNNMYLLLIDEEAEIGFSYYIDDIGEIRKSITDDKDYWSVRDEYHKIIAYYPLTKEAKELDLPLLPNPFKDTIPNSGYEEGMFGYTDTEVRVAQNAFQEGYKAAQSKGQYSLGDIKRAINFDKYHYEYGNIIASKNDEEIENFIQSLSTQKLPKEFIPEYEKSYKINSDGENIGFPVHDTNKLKTIINSEGKEELVGVYKY